MSEKIASLVSELGQLLQRQGKQIAIAESCTGGMVSSSLVADPDVGGCLERGLVVYSIDAKCQLLALDRDAVEACDGVSQDVACAMAISMLKRSEADIALAITGFAGPQEGQEEVGLVYIALAQHPGKLNHQEHHFGDVGRERVRELATRAALELALENVRSIETA